MMLCKVLVVGNAKCGKTSLIRRFSKDSFDSNYDTTVGVDFVRKDLEVSFPEQGRGGKAGGCECSSSAANVRMQLWDIAGQDRFAKLTRAYFRRAKAAAIVCDLTRKGTFEAVRQWKHEIDTWAGSGSEGGGAAGDNSAFAEDGRRDRRKLPVVLFANKSDLLEDTTASFLAGARMESVCRELGIVAWFVTSAKDGVNVEQGFRHLATLVAAKELGLDQDSAAASLTTPSSLSSTAAPTSPSSSQLFDRSRPWSVRKNKAHAAPTEAEEAGSEDDSSGDEEMSALLLGGDSLLTVWDLDDF
jgi:small GTP-binding protein